MNCQPWVLSFDLFQKSTRYLFLVIVIVREWEDMYCTIWHGRWLISFAKIRLLERPGRLSDNLLILAGDRRRFHFNFSLVLDKLSIPLDHRTKAMLLRPWGGASMCGNGCKVILPVAEAFPRVPVLHRRRSSFKTTSWHTCRTPHPRISTRILEISTVHSILANDPPLTRLPAAA